MGLSKEVVRDTKWSQANRESKGKPCFEVSFCVVRGAYVPARGLGREPILWTLFGKPKTISFVGIGSETNNNAMYMLHA